MKLLICFIVAFQVLSVICEDYYDYGNEENEKNCNRPDRISRPSAIIETICPCNANTTEGEVCQCDVKIGDHEPKPNTGGQNKVRVTLTKKMCWEKVNDEQRFYDDCESNAHADCQHEDKIEICYKDDIDAAQALCRQANKGDAFEVVKSGSGRKLKRNLKGNRRTWLATLNCKQLPNSLKDCTLEFKNINECDQMIAHCWFNNCWQPGYVVRAAQSGTARYETVYPRYIPGRYGWISGTWYPGYWVGRYYSYLTRKAKVRYGQACKIDGILGRSSVCGTQCFRCPDGSLDGTKCFAASTYSPVGELMWEPHFRTLDGKHFDFQGQCSYYLLKNGHFHIIAKFSVCGKYGVTCTRELTIKSGRTELWLGQGHNFTVKYRGRLLTRAKKPFHNDDINYYLASSEFDAVDVWNGFKILWDRKAEYRAVLPSWNNVGSRGLLGNFNNDTTDDMIMPNGVLAQDPLQFGNSWLVPGSCPPGVSPNAPQNPVLTDQEKNEAHEYCKYLNPDGTNSEVIPDPFKNCSSPKAMKERRAEYNNCIMDIGTCFPSRAKSECLCPSFEFMADFCERNEMKIGDWRAKMPDSLCKLDCDKSKGEEFRMDGNPCKQTCDAIKYQAQNIFNCILTTIEGCNCPEGMARNDQGTCILIEDCFN